MQKLFYVRIDIIDLMDFATDPEGENMSLLTFAKELKKEKSEYPQIQRMINEAHCYMEQKKVAGKKSAEKRAKKAKEEAEKAVRENSDGVAAEVNGVERRSNGVAAEVSAPSTNNSNNNRTTKLPTIQEADLFIGDSSSDCPF